MSYCDNYKKGFVELLLLALLAEGDKYGYEVSQEISQRSGGQVKVIEGSLYPVLYKLLDAGHVTDRKVKVGRRLTRVYYHLEPSGLARFQDMLRDYNQFVASMAQILAGPQGTEKEVLDNDGT